MKLKTFLGATLITASALSAAQVNAYEAGQIIVRAGPANVNPDASSTQISLGGTALAGTSVDVEDDTQLGITLTYMLKDNIGVSLLASTPFAHDIKESGVGVVNVGSTKHLPPTLTFQYYPEFGSDSFQPYVGAGVNYTKFFSEEASSELSGALGNASVSLDDSFGLALEVGADFAINDKWSVNAAIWMIDIDTDARITTDAGLIEVGVEIDPMVYMIGAAYRF